MNNDNPPLVSIITATYNNARFLPELIESVRSQSHERFEWIVVDNGSVDESKSLFETINDPRIRVIALKENVGVSAARNVGLAEMKGEAFCFVDGDDILPNRAIEARLKVLYERPETAFIDGKVITFDNASGKTLATYQPAFRGEVLDRLLELDTRVFMGNTWMIKRQAHQHYRFKEGMTHAEELLFYISIAAKGSYDFTTECVLRYRKHGPSAMTDLVGLDRGYEQLVKEVRKLPHVKDEQVNHLASTVKRIMVKSYLKEGKLWQAVRRWFRA